MSTGIQINWIFVAQALGALLFAWKIYRSENNKKGKYVSNDGGCERRLKKLETDLEKKIDVKDCAGCFANIHREIDTASKDIRSMTLELVKQGKTLVKVDTILSIWAQQNNLVIPKAKE